MARGGFSRKSEIMQYSKRCFNSLASSIVITFVVLAAIISPANAQSTRLSDAELASAVNEMLEKTYKSDEPGAAVIVYGRQGGLRRVMESQHGTWRSYRTRHDLVGPVRSPTVHGAAILCWPNRESSRWKMTSQIPAGFPAKGKRSREHLLTHTSGSRAIPQPEWLPLWRKDIRAAS